MELVSVCGGGGTCRGCLVRLAEGKLHHLSLEEQATWKLKKFTAAIGWPARPCPPVMYYRYPAGIINHTAAIAGRGCFRVQTVGCSPIHFPAYGLAFDIGTTKLAGFLVELNSGHTLVRTGQMNPQIAYGEDVIARIVYCNEHEDGRTLLQTRLVETLNRMIDDLCSEAHLHSW